jgi:hypothetical protein
MVVAAFGWCFKGQAVEVWLAWDGRLFRSTSRKGHVFRKRFKRVRGRRRLMPRCVCNGCEFIR